MDHAVEKGISVMAEIRGNFVAIFVLIQEG